MSVYEETQAILNTYKIQANKSLGQNFLIDDCVIEKIIESSNIEKEDLIIEIGPGLGVLTERLLKKSNNVVVIELDKKMIEILQNRFCLNRNLEIINNDVLKVDLEKLIKNKKEQTNINKVKIVANLPYYISTPIIMKLLENRLEISEIIVMVQKEVADRMKKLLSEYNNQEEKTLEDILNFHVKFECIHPFQDGNGRVGRLIMRRQSLV